MKRREKLFKFFYNESNPVLKAHNITVEDSL